MVSQNFSHGCNVKETEQGRTHDHHQPEIASHLESMNEFYIPTMKMNK